MGKEVIRAVFLLSLFFFLTYIVVLICFNIPFGKEIRRKQREGYPTWIDSILLFNIICWSPSFFKSVLVVERVMMRHRHLPCRGLA